MPFAQLANISFLYATSTIPSVPFVNSASSASYWKVTYFRVWPLLTTLLPWHSSVTPVISSTLSVHATWINSPALFQPQTHVSHFHTGYPHLHVSKYLRYVQNWAHYPPFHTTLTCLVSVSALATSWDSHIQMDSTINSPFPTSLGTYQSFLWYEFLSGLG